MEEVFGFSVSVVMRTENEFGELIRMNPFLGEKDDTGIYVTFLSEAPVSVNISGIDSKRAVSEEFVVHGKEIYLYCPNGYGKTELSNNLFERELNVVGTTRNWRTVVKLYELVNKVADRSL